MKNTILGTSFQKYIKNLKHQKKLAQQFQIFNGGYKQVSLRRQSHY